LYRVATAELSDTFRATTLVARAGKYMDEEARAALRTVKRDLRAKPSKAAAPTEIVDAMHSALTKFDSLGAKFGAGEVPTTVIATLLREMRDDLSARHVTRAALLIDALPFSSLCS